MNRRWLPFFRTSLPDYGVACLTFCTALTSVLSLSLAPGLLQAENSSSATARIAITKRETAHVEPARTILTLPVISNSKQSVTHLCLEQSAHSVPYSLHLDSNSNQQLVDATGQHTIAYHSHLTEQPVRTTCGQNAAVLSLTVDSAHSTQVPAGFYSDNLIVMVSPE